MRSTSTASRRCLAALAALAVPAAAPAAEGTLPPDSPSAAVVAGNPVYSVVATRGAVVAATPGAVLWISGDGGVVRRPVAAFASTDPRELGRSAAMARRRQQLAADEALFDRYGVEADVREELEGEEWLEETRPAGTPAAGSGAPEVSPLPLLASAGTYAFAAVDGRLLHVRQHTLEPVGGTKGVNLLAATPDGVLASFSEGGIVLSKPTVAEIVAAPRSASAPTCFVAAARGPVDEAAILTAPLREPGACAGSSLLWRQGDRLSQSRDGAPAVRLPWRARGMAACGDGILLNVDEGMFHLTPAAPEEKGRFRLGDPAPHPRVRCLPGNHDVILSFSPEGLGAAVSLDRGRTWVELAAATGVAINDAAITETGAWLATSHGLWQVTAGTQRAPSRASQPLQRPAALPWLAWLPRVDVMAAVSTRAVARGPTHDARGVNVAEAWLAADFPLTPRAAQPQAPQITSSVLPESATVASGAMAPPRCLEDLREAAVALALADPARVRSLVSRARYAGWLPELRLRMEKRLGRNQAADYDMDTTLAPLEVRTVNDMRLEVRASWDLSRVVYSPDELAVTVQAARLADVRREVSTLVNRLFFERRQREEVARRAHAEAARGEGTPPNGEAAHPETQLDQDPEWGADDPGRRSRVPRLRSTSNLQALRAAELSADLDALTGGMAARCH